MRWKESNTLVALAASLHLRRAALCCDESCEAVFDMVPGKSPQIVRCPGCGGSSWIPLSTIVPSFQWEKAGPQPLFRRLIAASTSAFAFSIGKT